MGSETEFGAVVVGSEPYAIMLQWAHGVLAALCNCPYFMGQGENCKHLWLAYWLLMSRDILAKQAMRLRSCSIPSL